MDQELRSRVEAWLRYHQDLGLTFFAIQRSAGVHQEDLVSQNLAGHPESPTELDAFAGPVSPIGPMPAPAGSPSRIPPVLPVLHSASLFDQVRLKSETLENIREDLGDCTRCRLHQRRTNLVFGAGNPKAQLVFVGEGPGHDEDVQGLPFVGRAGKLLTQMIEAMGLERPEVYICNVVKCRPPENRTPEKDEITTCSPFLFRQLDAIAPRAVVCLGSVALQALVGASASITRSRGQWFDFRGSRLMPTYHPAYLLRNPAAKSEVWEDLKKVMAFLGLQPKRLRR